LINHFGFLQQAFDTLHQGEDAPRSMTPQPTAAGMSAIAFAPQLRSGGVSSVYSLVVVGLLLGLVLLPLIALGCGPPT
jgi:hypothetical protein